jgi:hypothetical protein
MPAVSIVAEAGLSFVAAGADLIPAASFLDA